MLPKNPPGCQPRHLKNVQEVKIWLSAMELDVRDVRLEHVGIVGGKKKTMPPPKKKTWIC